jgi:hypothetical protein
MIRRILPVPTFAALVLAGCLPSGEPSDGPIDAAPGAGPVRALVALEPTDHPDQLAREPMIVETSDGALLVSGYGSGPRARLWRSHDEGSTWERVEVGTEEDGAIGNSDVDLAVGPDGTIYFVNMSFDREKFEGTGITIGSSLDAGSSWVWSSLSSDRFDDRPWVEVAPDGVAHAIWNDGEGVSHATSSDRGQTWTEQPRIHPIGGSSHLAIGPDGTLAVRITPLSASGNQYDPGIDHVAVSIDGGSTWTLRELPGERVWSEDFDPAVAPLRWVEPLAWDAGGALYALSSEGTTLWLARSTDRGASWTRWPLAQGDEQLYFPYLVARGRGELAATWFSSLGEPLRVNVAHVELGAGADAEPRVARADAFSIPVFGQPDAAGEVVRETAGEYVPVIFLGDDRLAVVTTIQDPSSNRWGFTFRPYSLER